ncbi:MAG TPA: DUF1810 domain-containing protein [Candidatus Didemnitutus sp.]|nr:DUF1810 domain-containing protein [Candidatus Didemnitutus sp.]
MTRSSDDPNDLERFVTAQEANYADAIAELRGGRKQTHWMWYVFPQVAGLGTSPMAVRYAINSRAEAVAYLAHPVLGPRLRECSEALLQISGKTAREVMGQPDDVKLQSSMTLFAALSPTGAPFAKVLERYYGGATDPRTIEFLAGQK